MHWLSDEHREPALHRWQILNVDIKQARETLAQLEETTWGVTLNGRSTGSGSLVLPAGSPDYPPWTVGGRACRDAVERVTGAV